MTARHQRSPLARVWWIIKPSAGRSLASVVLSCLSLICVVGLIATSGWLISRAWQQPPILALVVATAAIRAFALGRGVFRYSERLVSHDGALRGLTSLRARIVSHLATVAPAGVPGLARGDALRRMIDDVDNTADVGLRVALPTASAVIVGVGVTGFVAWLVPLAALLLLAGLLIAGILAPVVAYQVGARSTAHAATLRGQLAADIVSQFEGCADVVAANAAPARLQQTRDLDEQLRDLDQRSARGMGLAGAVAVFAQGVALIGILLVAIPAVRSSGSLDGVSLAVVVLIPLVAFEIVAGLPAAALALVRSRTSAGRIVEVLDSPDLIPDPDTPAPLPTGPYSLRVRSLSVSWKSGATPTIADIDLDLVPGRRVAIVGPSGCGKSTLAAALAKLAPHTGSITLNDVDTAMLTGDSVRQVVGLCPQNSHIFDNSIAENVRLARPSATDDDVGQALRDAELWDWVAVLPRGIQTPVGEHGAACSGGQRRRLALARTALSEPPIAIFDEPTEHLDRASADALTEQLLDCGPNRAVVIITHALEGLANADEIVVLLDGRVAQRGSFNELAQSNGWFADNLARQQAVDFAQTSCTN